MPVVGVYINHTSYFLYPNISTAFSGEFNISHFRTPFAFHRSSDQSLSMIQLIVTHRPTAMNRPTTTGGDDQKDLQRSTVTCFDRRQRYTNAFCLLISSWPTHFLSVLHHRVPVRFQFLPSAFSSFPFGLLRFSGSRACTYFLSRHCSA